jgi:Adaptin N terminal region
MSLAEGPCYTLINASETDPYNEMQIKQDLEKGEVNVKIDTLKKVIQLMLNGERLPGLLMTIIRFVLPLQNHTIKKLLLIYWEIVPKTSSDGKLLQEMILVCDAYRKDLQHPNEFLRGSTLRFLCKLKEPELLEPLMPSIRACLDHRHSYVRRNAVLAIFTIYKNFDWLVPDGPELIANFLDTQQDMSCKRNAFLMLLHADQERALNYLASCLDQVNNFGDILQLVIVELIYKVCHANPAERSRFIRCIYNLLNSTSNAVRYEAAGTLVTLSSAPTAIKAAVSCYIDLIIKESDNNVKLIVLDRLIALKENEQTERVMQEVVMDILRVLAAPDIGHGVGVVAQHRRDGAGAQEGGGQDPQCGARGHRQVSAVVGAHVALVLHQVPRRGRHRHSSSHGIPDRQQRAGRRRCARVCARGHPKVCAAASVDHGEVARGLSGHQVGQGTSGRPLDPGRVRQHQQRHFGDFRNCGENAGRGAHCGGGAEAVVGRRRPR